MSENTPNNIDVSVSFHQHRIAELKSQRELATVNNDWELYEALTQRIRENEDIIRELTTPQ